MLSVLLVLYNLGVCKCTREVLKNIADRDDKMENY